MWSLVLNVWSSGSSGHWEAPLDKDSGQEEDSGRTREARIPRSFRGALFGRNVYIVDQGEKDGDQRWSKGVGSSLSSGNSSGTSEFTHRNHGAGGVETEGSY